MALSSNDVDMHVDMFLYNPAIICGVDVLQTSSTAKIQRHVYNIDNTWDSALHSKHAFNMTHENDVMLMDLGVAPLSGAVAKWNQRIFDVLGNVNKPMWIFFVVLVWYAHEVFKSIISSSYYQIIWSNFLHDPCWADPEFLVNTSVVIRETCTDITSANNLFSQASANYRYYGQVENTWQTALEGIGGPFYGDPAEALLQTFPANCSASVLLNAIEPGDGSVNWWQLFIHSGALVALLLQIVLAHWFISWVNILRPLTMNRGRVMIPVEVPDNFDLRKEVRQFARLRQVFPFIFSTAMLAFLLVNLGASSSDSDMPRNVPHRLLILAFFQFVIIPLLIWRPNDEAK